MAKKKETTFEQYMKAEEIASKKEALWEKAEKRRDEILSRMPDCENKLFKYEGKEYVVTKEQPRFGWYGHVIDIREVQR